MTSTEYEFMIEAVTIADSCNPKKDSIPKVGAVIAKNDVKIGSGQRGTGDDNDDEHAEHNAFLSVHDRKQLPGATVYTTLEPCTREVRSKPLECCTEQLLRAKVKKVFIGILDPNQGVRGKGLWELQSHGIEVELFPPDLAQRLLAINEKFIRFQQTLGARVVQPAPNQVVELVQQKDGGWFGKCDLVIKCANDPDDSIKVIVQKGSGWWPTRSTLHRVGETREWKVEVHFGSDGDHTIHVVRAFEAGAALLSYYQDVVNRNTERTRQLEKRCADQNLRPGFLKGIPSEYQGIKMGGLPKGLESQTHVQVQVIKRADSDESETTTADIRRTD
jgi:pyrimidine deaminase RibD-like protein